MSFYAPSWVKILGVCGTPEPRATLWAPFMVATLDDHTFDGGLEELAQFLGQCLHESDLLAEISENLNYTVAALTATFGTARISMADAAKYGRTPTQAANQEAIANIVYGGPWGLKNLGNKNPGDGWKYRGSGLIQTTGFANFQAAEKATDIPFTTSPELMRTIGRAPIEAAIAWWNKNVTTAMLGDALALRKRVNGPAALGLQDCIVLTAKARQALAAATPQPD